MEELQPDEVILFGSHAKGTEPAGTHSVERSARKGGCSMSSHEAALQLIETDLLEPLAVVARGLVCEQMRQVDIF